MSGNKLGRNQTLRKATIRDLARATLIEQRICTTKAKAKEARKLVDRLITLGKKGTLAGKRKAFSILTDHSLVSDLFNTIAVRFKARNGGYTRIIPFTRRRGDNAELAFLELTEKDQVIISNSKTETVKKEAKTTGKAPQIIDVPAQTGKKKASKAEAKTAPEEKKKDKKSSEVKAPDAIKTPKKIMGGIKKIFKKPSAGGA